MGEVTTGILIGGLFSLLTVIIPMLLNAARNKADAKKVSAEATAIDTTTIRNLITQVNELIDRNDKLDERVDWLKNELTRYTRAYSLSIRFIRANLPTIDVPNFLESDPKLK